MEKGIEFMEDLGGRLMKLIIARNPNTVGVKVEETKLRNDSATSR